MYLKGTNATLEAVYGQNRAIARGKLMPFCRERVENSAVNYRGAKKIGGAKTRSESVEWGTDIAKIKPKIGNTPSRLGKSRT